MPRRRSGIFITLEGPDGSGKTTQFRRLAEAIRAAGYAVVTTREPGGVPLAETLRELLLKPGSTAPVAAAELLLFLAARAQHVAELIQPALSKKQVVLCERFSDSTLAYQVGGRKLSASLVQAADRLATGGLKPDLTLLFDVRPEVGLKRAFAAKSGHDRMEKEALPFQRRVRRAYLQLAKKEPGRIRVFDSEDSLEHVSAQAWTWVKRRLQKQKGLSRRATA
jgi:dTMP kinase